MPDITERTAERLVRAYGRDFLGYILAVPENTITVEVVQSADARLVAPLLLELEQAPFGGDGEINFTLSVSSRFSSYRDDLRGSLATYLHQAAGGIPEEMAPISDPVVQAICDVARDVWPVLLLIRPKHGLGAFWTSRMHGVFAHPSTVSACKAFMADESLRNLFPDVPSIEGVEGFHEILLEVQAQWIVSSGQSGTRQLISIIESIIFNAAVLSQLDGAPLTERGLLEAIPESVETFRALSTMEPVDVPAVVGFSGLQLPEGDVLMFDDDQLRSPHPVEKNLLLMDVGRVTSVFATNVPIQILDISTFRAGDSDEFFDRYQKYASHMQESRRALERRIDRMRLSLLLASEDDELLATSEVSSYTADPTQHGGGSTWQMDPRSPPGYSIGEGQETKVLRFYEAVRDKHPESLDIAVKRILSAVSQRWDASDAFIDAVVVWENAFGTSTETTFRVTGSIAKLLEPDDIQARTELQKELKRLYESRSRLVHGAKEPKPADAWNQRERAIQVALRLLRRLYIERPDLLELSSELRSARLLLES